jgi:hypothetical protein
VAEDRNYGPYFMWLPAMTLAAAVRGGRGSQPADLDDGRQACPSGRPLTTAAEDRNLGYVDATVGLHADGRGG